MAEILTLFQTRCNHFRVANLVRKPSQRTEHIRAFVALFRPLQKLEYTFIDIIFRSFKTSLDPFAFALPRVRTLPRSIASLFSLVGRGAVLLSDASSLGMMIFFVDEMFPTTGRVAWPRLSGGSQSNDVKRNVEIRYTLLARSVWSGSVKRTRLTCLRTYQRCVNKHWNAMR